MTLAFIILHMDSFYSESDGDTEEFSVADLGGRPGAHSTPTAQNFLNFMQFFAKFGKIICWRPPEGWSPLLREILDQPLVLHKPSGSSDAVAPPGSKFFHFHVVFGKKIG